MILFSPSSDALPRRLGEIALRALWVVVIGALPVIGFVAGPSYAGLVFGLGGLQFVAAAVQRRIPTPDLGLAWLAAGFAAWCWMGALWSIAPDRTLHGALQITAIFAGSLIFLSNRLPPDHLSDSVFRVLTRGLYVGVLILALDTLSGYQLQLLLGHGGHADTKYNRGLDYAVLIMWPLLAYAMGRRYRWTAVVVCGAMLAAIGFGKTSSAAAEVAAGIAAFTLARVLRNRTALFMSSAVSVMALALPYALRVFSPYRSAVAPYIKGSGLHRLELWDFMSSYIVARPFFGWGLMTSYLLRPTAEQLGHYVHVVDDTNGNYPHNQWVEIWVQNGLVGIMIATGFSWFVLHRIRRRLPQDLQPFAYAAFASCLVLSLLDFEVTTDSLWAAFAVTAFLFRQLGQDRRPWNRERSPSDVPS